MGTTSEKARNQIVEDLTQANKIKKIETLHHSVGTCYRDKGLIQPLVSKQWYLKVESLAKKALSAIRKREVKFAAERYEKLAKHWLQNLRDWNISRQIVWGMRIPAWRCQRCLEWTITEGEIPNKCKKCEHEKLIQDTDTFDTWFSSSQWPYATLQISKGRDFEYFYPTSLMETAYEILPFWVIRMIMLGIYTTKENPFKDVLIHGLVRDANGEKISKSKGNVIDPMLMTDKYGADALRMGIIWAALVETDISLSEDNIRGQRNFANKIWNVARFVFMELPGKRKKRNEDDIKIIKELKTTIRKVTRLLNSYRLNEASGELYDFFWNKFANDYLEKTKTRRSDAQKTLEFILQESLKLLHPFMPFVTEVVWQEGKERFDSPHLITAKWPS